MADRDPPAKPELANLASVKRTNSTSGETRREGEAVRVARAGKAALTRRARTQPAGPASAIGKATKSAGRMLPASGGEVTLGYLGDFVSFHLRLAQDASYRVFARRRDKDLAKPGRFPALAIIHLNPGISQSALGRAIARDKSTVSPLIKDLQENGFINRKPSTHDRRSVTLALTKKGERTLNKLHARAAEHEGELDRLLGSSKARLMAMLDKIARGMALQAQT